MWRYRAQNVATAVRFFLRQIPLVDFQTYFILNIDHSERKALFLFSPPTPNSHKRATSPPPIGLYRLMNKPYKEKQALSSYHLSVTATH